MVVTEIIKDKFIFTYSDINHYIERDGIIYENALDLIGQHREYTETNEEIPAYDEGEEL